ncbi:hypothetical protein LY78DRAFT_685413 [Colletotrichum sublineola]|nr:hypothetical protein LY78DRAFT_685413 [Colletotrichum sublineola]
MPLNSVAPLALGLAWHCWTGDGQYCVTQWTVFPNNQHPYNDAGDVRKLRLNNESILLVLTRHILELSVALDKVLTLNGLNKALQQQQSHDVATATFTTSTFMYIQLVNPAVALASL